jgi:hypothetical protein
VAVQRAVRDEDARRDPWLSPAVRYSFRTGTRLMSCSYRRVPAAHGGCDDTGQGYSGAAGVQEAAAHRWRWRAS